MNSRFFKSKIKDYVQDLFTGECGELADKTIYQCHNKSWGVSEEPGCLKLQEEFNQCRDDQRARKFKK